MTLDKLAGKLLPKSIYQRLYVLRHLQKLSMRKGAYLVETGYINSIKRMEPVNKEGKPIPWMNYSFIDFLEPRLNSSMRVFEYGSGYSSFYLAEKVQSVTSIEYDKEWFSKVKDTLNEKENCEIYYYPSPEKYKMAIKDHGKELYDIIFIDGNDREQCAKQVIPYLSEKGVVILDDSWRDSYSSIFEYFKEYEFRQISISGLKAGGLRVERTTVFYRENNVLEI